MVSRGQGPMLDYGHVESESCHALVFLGRMNFGALPKISEGCFQRAHVLYI